MRIAEIIGTVTLCRSHPSFQGATLKLAVPLSLADLSLANLSNRELPQADPLVVWDALGAGMHNRIAMSEGSEAAQPFRPAMKPVDAYNAALLDKIELEEKQKRLF